MSGNLTVEIERNFVILEHGGVVLKVGPDSDGLGLVQIDFYVEGDVLHTGYLTLEVARALGTVLQEVEVA